MRAFPLVLLLLVACSDEPPREAPPRVGDVAGPEAEPSVVTGPTETFRIEPGQVGVVTVQDGMKTYDVNLGRGIVLDDGEAPLDEAAAQAWLSRFAPLDAGTPYEGVTADEVESGYTSLLTFLFTDGSARTLWIERRDDGLAVLTRSGGDVTRLPADDFRRLVPEASSLAAP